MRRIFQVLVLIPLGIILIALSVANRAPVQVTLDPFNPGNAALTASVPLFALLLGALLLGALIGSFLTWLNQGKHRSRAREASNRASAIEREAASLKAERAQLIRENVAVPALRNN
jgi:uncharacterized integral membrane protein